VDEMGGTPAEVTTDEHARTTPLHTIMHVINVHTTFIYSHFLMFRSAAGCLEA